MDNIDIDFNSLDDGIIDDLYDDVLETGTFLARVKCYSTSYSYAGGNSGYCSFTYCDRDINDYPVNCYTTPTQLIDSYQHYFYCTCPYEG